ncbi:MAG TPA: hypothetical protein VHT75_04220 [Acidimicrobiales bacterium]|jgi:hypothetical protein|nr:hypothetical protein [Acidimicrobiales bacterium]
MNKDERERLKAIARLGSLRATVEAMREAGLTEDRPDTEEELAEQKATTEALMAAQLRAIAAGDT